MNMNNETVRYYDTNACSYYEDTADADVSVLRRIFIGYLKPGSLILDFGCGSGRDTKAFLKEGIRVDAIDGSMELCRLAEKNTGVPVRHMMFQQLDESCRYDGIWACASILHLQSGELADVLQRMKTALKDEGVAYLSFKYGAFEDMRNDRWFTDMTEEKLCALLRQTGELKPARLWVTSDVRKQHQDERWLNAIVRRCRESA